MIEIKELKPLKDTILAYNIELGSHTLSSGIIIPDDNGKVEGIKPRKFTVYDVGPDIDYLKSGDVILVEHGRWSRGHDVEIDGINFKIHKIDTSNILLVFDDK